jgi:hypothetical protein
MTKPDSMNEVITLVRGTQSAINWIGPIVCFGVGVWRPDAEGLCNFAVDAHGVFSQGTELIIARYQKDPTEENAQALLKQLVDLKAKWETLDRMYKAKGEKKQSRIHPFDWLKFRKKIA